MTNRLYITISVLLIAASLHAQSTFHSMKAQHNVRTYVLGNSQDAPQPVTNSSSDRMSSGSRYMSSSHEVGASAPVALYEEAYDSPAGAPGGRRNSPPADDDDDYDPSNAQYGPLPDGTLFLLLLAALTAAYGYVSARRKKNYATISNQ